MNYLKKITDFLKNTNDVLSRRHITKETPTKTSFYQKMSSNTKPMDNRINISKSTINNITKNITERDIYSKRKGYEIEFEYISKRYCFVITFVKGTRRVEHIYITQLEDEWFMLNIDDHNSDYNIDGLVFKCDQLEGLYECLKDNKFIR